MSKRRADRLLVERGLAESRSLAQRLVMSGRVWADGQPVHKPSTLLSPEAQLELREGPRYVSRGGEKLEAALAAFEIDPRSWVCADIGASTGGFTDCLLQHGASKVYAIDVGHGQLHWKLRNQQAVVVMERTNARELQALPESVQLVTIDVSFISLGLILPRAADWLAPRGQVVALVKPQFEAGREQVGKGGVVRDPAVHRQVLRQVIASASESGLTAAGLIRSPLTGPKGNVEFLLWLRIDIEESVAASERMIEAAFEAGEAE